MHTSKLRRRDVLALAAAVSGTTLAVRGSASNGRIGSVQVSAPETGMADSVLARAIGELIARGGGDLVLQPGVYTLSAPMDGQGLSSSRLLGYGAVVRAGSGTSFEYLLSLSGTTGVTIEGIDFDCNRKERGSAAVRLMAVVANATKDFRAERCIFRNTLGAMINGVPHSAAALTISGGALRPIVRRCTFLDLGLDANIKPSDGVFMRANEGLIIDCRGMNVTDHVAVLEGCNRSTIRRLRVRNVTSAAAISNDTNADCAHNLIDDVSGTSNYLGSFGGIVGVYAGFGGSTGRVLSSDVTNIDVAAADNARGGGPGIFLYGPVDAISMSNIRVDAGKTTGKMNHACLIDGISGVTIRDSRFRADGIGAAIRIINAARDILLADNVYENGLVGIAAAQTAQFRESGSAFIDCDVYVSFDDPTVRL
ncbi:hypothetical protein [Qipengyuania sp.]|uniref:hypothetical protein n=1 Tax=Qipengyuania sp. TaxID=2004515 RepID=UPI0035C7BD34